MNIRFEYSRDELLADHPYTDRLAFLGKQIHGGLLADGSYCSPRTLYRRPAIDAWRQRVVAAGQPSQLVHREIVPAFFPSVPQSKLLLRYGVVEPLSRILTQTANMEANGNAGLEAVPKPPLASLVKEPIAGTTLAHLYIGLMEAHGRDEAGFGDEGGHDTMWRVARDLGLDCPPEAQPRLKHTSEVVGRASGTALPSFHPEIPRLLEAMLHSLVTLLVMEVFAESTMAWAQALLDDPEVSRNRAAGRVVSYIQNDEQIHIDYLTTMMLELRARTFITDEGEVPGAPVIDEIVQRMTRASINDRIGPHRRMRYEQIKQALSRETNGDRILHEFRQLSEVPLPEEHLAR